MCNVNTISSEISVHSIIKRHEKTTRRWLLLEINDYLRLFTASLNALPAENFAVLAAGILISAPVAGLRPTRAARLPDLNVPKPIN